MPMMTLRTVRTYPEPPGITDKDEGRKRALRYYRVIAVLMCLCSLTIFVAAIPAAANYNDSSSLGVPYYIGGFITGSVGLIHTAVTVFIARKIPDFYFSETKRQVQWAILGQYLLSIIEFAASFTGIILASGIASSVSLFSSTGRYAEQQRAIAICLIVGSGIILLLSLFCIHIVCSLDKYFDMNITCEKKRVVTTTRVPVPTRMPYNIRI